MDINNLVNDQIHNNIPSSHRLHNIITDTKRNDNRNEVSPTDFIRERSISGIKVDQNISEIKNNFNKSTILFFN